MWGGVQISLYHAAAGETKGNRRVRHRKIRKTDKAETEDGIQRNEGR